MERMTGPLRIFRRKSSFSEKKNIKKHHNSPTHCRISGHLSERRESVTGSGCFGPNSKDHSSQSSTLNSFETLGTHPLGARIQKKGALKKIRESARGRGRGAGTEEKGESPGGVNIR